MEQWPCHSPAGYKRGGWELGPSLWRRIRRVKARMSRRVTFADEAQPYVRRTRVRFWDGMRSSCLMPNITSKERISVWDAVSVYIQEHLQLRQGVRIPALGSFDIVPRWVKDGNETVIFLMPTFRLARNLVITHNLTDDKEYLPGHKELEPLKVAEVAANACMSQQKVENCIRGTTSLISRCLGKGENIALVLKDVGVLLIEGTRVQMKFYYEFLEKLSGKENLQKAVFKIPHLMDMVVSRVAPLASLTFTGHVIVFPEFEMESMRKTPPQEHYKAWSKEKKKEGALPLLSQAGRDKAAAGSSLHPAQQGETEKPGEAPCRLPVIPGLPPRKEQKSAPKGKAGRGKTDGDLRRRAGGGAGKFPPCEGENLTRERKLPRPRGPTALSFPVISVLSPASSEASLPEESAYNIFRLQPPGDEAEQLLKTRPETFWTVLKDPQKKMLSMHSTKSTHPLPPVPRPPTSARPEAPKTRPGFSILWPWPQ
ncbi:uncharacterized protein [Anser cygnoides]|uniref:uncharacterized protein n=1 Tax=Anser cygnoides TaxID=8845 RepID=UPI0034D18ACA